MKPTAWSYKTIAGDHSVNRWDSLTFLHRDKIFQKRIVMHQIIHFSPPHTSP